VLTDLIGSSTVRFLPKILAIPTRFDMEYIWTATANSLTLFDYNAEAIRGTFYQKFAFHDHPPPNPEYLHLEAQLVVVFLYPSSHRYPIDSMPW
jgi:hypothetical protein